MDILNTKIKDILTEKTLKVRPENIKSGVNILGIDGSVIELKGEVKTVNPTTNQQTIIPTSTGKNALTQVTVNAVTNTIDNNIVEGNIKSGVSILGVQGSSKVLDTTDSNAVANDIVTGKTAFVNGQKITGTYTGIIPTGTKNITENGTVDVTNYASASVNVPAPSPNLQSKSIEITENGTQTISADSGYDGLNEVEITTNVQSSGGGGKSGQSVFGLYGCYGFTYIGTGLKLTVNKTGTYTIKWIANRNSTAYDTFGTALYIDNSLYGTARETWGTDFIRNGALVGTNNSYQYNEVKNVTLTQGQTVEIYAKSGKSSASYTAFVYGLGIEEE